MFCWVGHSKETQEILVYLITSQLMAIRGLSVTWWTKYLYQARETVCFSQWTVSCIYPLSHRQSLPLCWKNGRTTTTGVNGTNSSSNFNSTEFVPPKVLICPYISLVFFAGWLRDIPVIHTKLKGNYIKMFKARKTLSTTS